MSHRLYCLKPYDIIMSHTLIVLTPPMTLYCSQPIVLGVRTEDLVQDLGVNNQYKKTYEGPSLIRDNPDTTHRMATRSHKHTPP
jgi:hypothetical protein